MIPNFLIIGISSFIPMLIGYAWFHPKVFGGNRWYDAAKLTGKDRTEVSTGKLLFTIVLNFLIALGLFNLCIHQAHVIGTVGGDIDALKSGTAAAFLQEYGTSHLNFGHGAFHALLPGVLTFVIPILGYVAIFENKGWNYFFIYLGYWTISLGLMGGTISQWGTTML